ncbi:MAG: hypothetical protein IKY67_06385 [Paludibacteraceae bacterium]|nr:hypothetical protein [Paludibacteraceae bacterium]
MKFEVCVNLAAWPTIIEADDIDHAYEIAYEMTMDDFDWMEIEVTDVMVAEEE